MLSCIRDGQTYLGIHNQYSSSTASVGANYLSKLAPKHNYLSNSTYKTKTMFCEFSFFAILCRRWCLYASHINQHQKNAKLDEPFGSILYLMMIYFICMYDWWYDTFRYTQSKRGSKKVDWCMAGAWLTIAHTCEGARLENKIRRILIYACTDEKRFMFRFGT